MRTVMLVEDEEFILQGIRCIIDWEEIGMSVSAMVRNGREALVQFHREPVDIVVTDVEMPQMNGLELLGELRKISPKTRCIILSGHDEFEYARSALKLDVEEYILKPVNEDQLKQALLDAAAQLDEIERKNADDMGDKIGWHRLLKGKLGEEEAAEFYRCLPNIDEGKKVYAAVMKIDTASVDSQENIQEIFVEIQKNPCEIRPIYLAADTVFLMLYTGRDEEEEGALEIFGRLQNSLESMYGIMSFFTVASAISDYRALPESYRTASRLQKYRILEGYGSCIASGYIMDRKTKDVVIDETLLRKLILKKDQDGVLGYVEDLFVNNLKSEVNVDVLYQLALKLAVFLQDVRAEYRLGQGEQFQNLSELVEQIDQADDIFGLKTIFISEISEIINCLHLEDSQYTPVVRQIIGEVQKNYREDMNLKTLSYKYHMNASYLGQIFQKEVGCSFARYLSNTKNKAAKDLILNTNMKINDIAKEVGYPDTSYFYRKFKQCYGVSPASLRSIKKA